MSSVFRTSFFVLIAWAGMAHAAIHYVPDDFISLQDGLDECPANDTLVCRDGTYRGPFFIWARNITIASEFILTQNPFHIANCIIRPGNGAHHRCFDTQAADSTDTELRMVGITIALARAIEIGENFGGGLMLRNRTADIQDCVFKSCLASSGGAIYSDSSNLTLTRCLMQSNDAIYEGRMLYARQSNVLFKDCDLGPSGQLFPGPGGDAEMQMNGCGIELRTTRIHEIGYVGELCEFFRNVGGATSRYLRLYGCTIENSNLRTLLEANPNAPREFVMDSCIIRNNQIWFGFFQGYSLPQTRTGTFTRNWFEGNYHAPNTGGNGLLYFSLQTLDYIIEENYFLGNTGAYYSCIGLVRTNSPIHGRAQRNFFVENWSQGTLVGDTIVNGIGAVGEEVFEYNSMVGNFGHALFTSEYLSPTSFALHNYWGDSTGPYEATRNPGGLGDTTNAATIYDEWLQSEDEIPDTSQFPDAVEDKPLPIVSTWRLGKIYPNPFNNEFRVELDGMTGADFEIRMFDLLGREVALLHSGRTLRGTLSFSAPPNLSAGIYFLRGRDHLFTETKKILYLK